MQSLPRKPFAVLAALLVALAAPVSIAHAQATGTIRGTVTDSASQRGVSGVQVTIAGTTRGTVTNDNGAYTLTAVPSGTVTVRAQRLGYSSQSRSVTVVSGEAVTADFQLHPVATVLSAVVSVGYGTATRQDVSSAIASVDSSVFANTPVAGVDNALQGRIPGVQVMQNSGEPGSGISIRVRGPASLNAGNQPLYVVDGVPMIQGSLSQIALSGQDVTAITGLNPDEIASIDVLKDAAAAAIYGSRGSNGVAEKDPVASRPRKNPGSGSNSARYDSARLWNERAKARQRARAEPSASGSAASASARCAMPASLIAFSMLQLIPSCTDEGIQPRKRPAPIPFRPRRGSADGSDALRQALSNASAAANGIPRTAASAKIWSLEVPTMQST